MASVFITSLTFILNTVIYSTNAACTWPSDFVDSTWIDSLKGDLVFGTTQVEGWSVNVQIQGDASLQVLDVWECVLNETGPYLIMKTKQTFLQFVVNIFYGYRCLKLEKITDASYRYYQMDPVQNAIHYERLTPNEDGSLTDPSFLCENSQVTPATGSEFQVMIKKGYESVAMVTCPYSLLVDYTFAYVDTSDSTMSCDQNNDVGNIDLCSNITMVTLQSPACSSYPLYSDADTTMCVDVVTVGSDTFISLYNYQYDSFNTDSNIYQFACVGINSNGSSMSVTPEHCKANQSPTEIPVTNSNQAVGAVWSLTPTGAPCPPCPELSAPAQGTVTIVTNGATTSATYTCHGNYTLSGNETRTCQTMGTWSGKQPSCTCPLPSSPTNGNVTVSTDGLNATFTCNAGYVLGGNSEHTCDIVTNVWSDTEPSCTECEQLTAPASGSIEIITSGMTSVVYYECDAGATIFGDDTRTCQQDTTWTLSAPTCTSCPSLSSISSGNITLTTSGTTTTAIFTCFDGYDLVGDNTSVCTPNGTWDSSSPSCECMTPNEPGNGSLTISTDKTEVTYTCDLGYSINGPEVRYCQSDGTGWSSVDPSCTLCEGLSSPTNGSATTSTNSTITKVTYSCDVGFTMNGDSISSCESDGSWSTNSPTCSECNKLPTVTLGSYTFKTDGTTTYAEYTCDVGTTISGDITVSCDANGEWAASSVNVSCVACPDLFDLIDGSVSIETNGTTSIAEFVCESEYEIQGDTSIECQSDSTWSSVTPECVKTGSSAESQSNTSDLLPAVIAMAIVIFLLVVALVASGIYIWKLKKSVTTDNDKTKTKTKTATNGILLNEQRPPLDHRNAIMETWKTFTHSPAPVSHNNTPRSDSFNSPLSMKSLVSAGSLNFDLVRETTTSSVYTDHPAPWSNKTLKDRDNNFGNYQIGPFPPIDEHKPGALTMTKHNNGTSSPRRKKISYGKKMQRQNSSTNGQKSNTTSSLGKTAGTNKRRIPTSGAIVAKHRAILASAGNVGGMKSKFEQEKAERASTPVKHNLEVKDSEINDTPRSNTFTTVQ